jgi:hypothetical protein
MMERPLGIKIAVAIEILIVLLFTATSLFALIVFEETKSLIPDTSEIEIPGGWTSNLQQFQDSIFAILRILVYVRLFFGLLHLIPAYLLWKGIRMGRYIATLFIVLDFFIALPSVIFAPFILYFVWIDKKSRKFLSK